MLEEKIVEAITAELERQAASQPGTLSASRTADGFRVSGLIDVEALAMVVAGSVAGGP
jgi:hypothetical protein